MLGKAPDRTSLPEPRPARQSENSRARCAARMRVVTDRSLSAGARLLYVLLDDFAGTKAECWPRQSTCGEKLGYSTRQVKRWIAELVKTGYIRSRRTLTGNRYALSWAVPENNIFTANVPTEGTSAARVFKEEPEKEPEEGNSNSFDTTGLMVPEFGLDDVRNILFWAAGSSA